MKKLITIILTSIVLSSCATGPDDPPADAPNMKEVYEAGMSGQTDYVVHQGIRETDDNKEAIELVKPKKVAVPSMAGALQNEQLQIRQADIDQDFPMLPNPQVLIYIYPHFKDGLPLHGNWTTLPLYEVNVYALPDEVNTGYNLRTY